MIFNTLYSLSLILVYLIYFPILLIKGKFKGRSKRYWLNLLGRGLPIIDKKKPLVWIHAVSVGEIAAVETFIALLKKSYPNIQILTSHITPTGYRRGNKIQEIDAQIYLPLDFSWIVKRVINYYSPNIVCVVETDHWYNFLRQSKNHGSKLVLLNGKMSLQSLDKYMYLKGLSRKLFDLYDQFYLQSQEYQDNFAKLGYVNTAITGNLKLDGLQGIYQSQLNKFCSKEKMRLVLASTHPGEEELLINALKELLQYLPDLQLLVVPRHPERFNQVYTLLQKHFSQIDRYSEVGLESDKPVLLVDTMGQLLNCYSYSTCAIVGGSFIEGIGGHNILEPIACGIYAYYGPYMFAQKEFVAICNKYDLGFQVSLNSLASRVLEFLKDPKRAQVVREKTQSFIEGSSGASENLLKMMLNDHIL